MDTIGTFDIAVEMCKQSLFTAIDKHRSIDEWKKFRDEHPECLKVNRNTYWLNINICLISNRI